VLRQRFLCWSIDKWNLDAFIGNNAFFHYSLLLVTKWLWPTLLATTLPSLFIWRATKKKRNQEQSSIK